MPSRDKRSMVYSAAAILFGAVLLNTVAGVLPGGQESVVNVPGAAALVAAVLMVTLGTRLPTRVLFFLGPLGALMIGGAVATNGMYDDSAVLYVWPAVWTAYFFGTRGAIFIVVWIGIVHGLTLLTLPPGQANAERWLDVEVALLVVVGVVRVMARSQAQLVERLAHEARVDALTGLLNRRGFEERLDVELARATRDQTWLTVVRFDLDHFKRVNDSYGHAAGDRLLAWLGAVITENIRGVDAAARVGGDELVVILPRTDAADGAAFAERIRRLVAQGGPGELDGLDISVTAGLASARAPTSSRQLLEDADRALYRAKSAGRNRVGGAALQSPECVSPSSVPVPRG